MNNRFKSLESTNWNEEVKQKVGILMKEKDYYSSEYSDSGDDSDTSKRKIIVHQLPWQRTRLTTIEKHLDEQHMSILSRRAKSMVAKRTKGSHSKRQLPAGAHKHSWAVRLATNHDKNNNNQSLATVTGQ